MSAELTNEEIYNIFKNVNDEENSKIKKGEKEMMFADNVNAEGFKNTRQKILHEAEKCVNGKRQEDYGTPENNFKIIADLWTDYLGGALNCCLMPGDVAMMMALLKIGRIRSGHGSLDNYIDLAGYAACAGEIYEDMHPVKSKNDIQLANPNVKFNKEG